MFRTQTYQQYFRVHSLTGIKSADNEVQWGGKIVLPQSALQKLTMMRVSYPMMFELKSSETQNKTHCGVLEFTAEEGRVYVPDWMLRVLGIHAGALIQVTNVTLELGSLIKIQPQSVDFLDISDPKAVLERSLRNFSALSTNDVFEISYNDSKYGIKVLEVKPDTDRDAISVVETDLEVDFAPPVGYVEPQAKPEAVSQTPQGGGMAAAINYDQQVTAPQQGVRLNGKLVETPGISADIYNDKNAPALNLPEGQLFFGYPVVPLEDENAPVPDQWSNGGTRLKQKGDK